MDQHWTVIIELDRPARSGESDMVISRIRAWIADRGGKMSLGDEATQTPNLIISVSSRAQAEDLAAFARDHLGVRTVYTKPPDALP